MSPAPGGEDGEGREGKALPLHLGASPLPSSALQPDYFAIPRVSLLAIDRAGEKGGEGRQPCFLIPNLYLSPSSTTSPLTS